MTRFSNTRTPPNVTLKRVRNNTMITIKPRNRVVAFFLVPFTVVWSGGSLTSIFEPQIQSGKFELINSLFGIPFLLGSVFLVLACYRLLFGKMVFKISSRELEFTSNNSVIRTRHRLKWNTVSEIKQETSTRKQVTLSVLSVVSEGKKIELGHFKEDVENFLLEHLKKAKSMYNP